jgi:hypothetical protein
MNRTALILTHDEHPWEVLRATSSAGLFFDTIILGCTPEAAEYWLAEPETQPPVDRIVVVANTSLMANRRELVLSAPEDSYCMLLDADDAFLPNLETFFQSVGDSPDKVMAGGLLEVYAEPGEPPEGKKLPALWSDSFPEHYGWRTKVEFEDMLAFPIIGQSCMLFRREWWLDIAKHLPSEWNAGEDWLQMALFTVMPGLEVLRIPLVMYASPHGRHGAMSSGGDQDAIRSWLRDWKEGLEE